MANIMMPHGEKKFTMDAGKDIRLIPAQKASKTRKYVQ